MKIKHLIEAKYDATNRQELWLKDALTIAETNKDRATNEDEWEFWDDYKLWLEDHVGILSQIYQAIKADRDTYLDQFDDPDPALIQSTREIANSGNDRSREVAAEIWSSSTEGPSYPIFKEFRSKMDTEEQHDYASMVGNTMFDILGGLRDER